MLSAYFNRSRWPMYHSIALFLITAVWGWTFVVVHGAAQEFGVIGFLAVRFCIATAVLAPWAFRSWSTASDRSGAVGPGVAGAGAVKVGAGIGTVLACGYLLQTFGLVNSTATNTGLITGLFVVFAPILNRVLFGITAGRLFWVAVGVSLIGLYLLASPGHAGKTGGETGQATLRGDLLTLGGAVCLGLHIALLDRYAKGYEPILLATAQLGSAAVTFLVVKLVAVSMASSSFIWPSPQVWLALIVTGVLASAIGFYVQTAAQRRLPAARIAVILTLEPVFAALFGWLLAGDFLTSWQICGAVLMGVALAMAEIYPRLRREWQTRRALRTTHS